uniref:Uncharacterized protein n=1 Tax=Romanomermis culicivorax TaxID=13658 RepID=A0A915IC11_ROMCU
MNDCDIEFSRRCFQIEMDARSLYTSLFFALFLIWSTVAIVVPVHRPIKLPPTKPTSRPSVYSRPGREHGRTTESGWANDADWNAGVRKKKPKSTTKKPYYSCSIRTMVEMNNPHLQIVTTRFV